MTKQPDLMIMLTPDSPRWTEFAKALAHALVEKGPGSCDHTCCEAEWIMTRMGGVDIPASLEHLESLGGYCDCEIAMNADPTMEFWGLIGDGRH
jgi:Protein of unknown function (DUF2695)